MSGIIRRTATPLFMCLLLSKQIEELIRRQAGISSSLASIARNMDAENPVEQRLRTILNSLAVSETVKAISSLEKLARAKTDAEKAKEVKTLLESQDRVIQILERILGVIAQMKERVENPNKKEKGSDLSDLEKEKYRELPKS